MYVCFRAKFIAPVIHNDENKNIQNRHFENEDKDDDDEDVGNEDDGNKCVHNNDDREHR